MRKILVLARKPAGMVLSLGYLLSFLLLGSCSTSSKQPTSEEPHTSSRPRLETIAILGTNDIHGAISPSELQTREKPGVKSTTYEAGGLSVLATYIKILRGEFGDRLLWLDGGDEFQGSIESNASHGTPMVKFFNTMGLNAAAVGNHEFDFGLPSLKKRMQEAKYPFLAANIIDKSSGKLADFPNTQPSRIFKVGHLNVGVVGLTTLDTPKTTQRGNIQTFAFEDFKSATLREAQSLREQGAHIVLITAHSGWYWRNEKGTSVRAIRKPTEIDKAYGEHDELVDLLNSLPPGTIDGVVSGHTHQVIHHWMANVPVIQGGAFGRYINVLYLTYDWNQHKLVPEESRIEGPIPVCERVFQNQMDCNGDRAAPKNGRGPLVPAQFHGKTVLRDRDTANLLDKTIAQGLQVKNQKLGLAVRPLEHPKFAESDLANLVADAIRHAAKSDFGFANWGGIRAPIEAGPITYRDIFKTLPFENGIEVMDMHPKELRTLLQVVFSGSRGLGGISGLRVRLIDPKFEAPFVDLNGNGQFAPWKINRLLDVTLEDGTPLIEDRYYKMATMDFLFNGGEDWSWPMSQIPSSRERKPIGRTLREAATQYIESLKSVNSPDQPLVNPSKPRLIFEKIVQMVKNHRKRKRDRQ